MNKNKEIEIQDELFELIDMVFKMHHQERMDKEEVILILQMLLSDNLDPEFCDFIRFAYKFRDKEGFDELKQPYRLDVSPKSHHYM